jgi:MFS family permease
MMLGLLFSLFGLAGGVASVLIGRLSDKSGNRVRYVRVGALLSAPLILGAAFAPDTNVYVLMVCALSVVLPLVPILLFALASDRMERREATLSLTRALLLNTGRVLGGILCVLMIFYTNDVRLAYAVMAFMILGAAFVK